MMPDQEMPADPFGPPEEMITMMRGLKDLHAAAMLSGFAEHTATRFVADVFVSFSLANQQGSPENDNDGDSG